MSESPADTTGHIKIWGKSAGEAPLAEPPGEAVRQAQQLVLTANAVLDAAVVAERARGTSWEQIGDALGVTRLTAHGRFRGAVDAFARGESDIEAELGARLNLERAWETVRDRAAARAVRDNLVLLSAQMSRAIDSESIPAEEDQEQRRGRAGLSDQMINDYAGPLHTGSGNQWLAQFHDAGKALPRDAERPLVPGDERLQVIPYTTRNFLLAAAMMGGVDTEVLHGTLQALGRELDEDSVPPQKLKQVRDLLAHGHYPAAADAARRILAGPPDRRPGRQPPPPHADAADAEKPSVPADRIDALERRLDALEDSMREACPVRHEKP